MADLDFVSTRARVTSMTWPSNWRRSPVGSRRRLRSSGVSPTSSSSGCGLQVSFAPARRPRPARPRRPRAVTLRLPRRLRAATPRPAGACRSRRPAACSAAGSGRTGSRRCSATLEASRPACGRRGEPPAASTAATACPAGGRSAAGSRTPTTCSAAASSTPARRHRTPRVLGMPVGELEIVDTWHTSGLRGTGSHDAVADDVFVPEHRSLSLFDAPTSDAPLYRFPIFGFFALSIAAAALGNARGAIDDLSSWPRTRSGWGRAARSRSAPATQSVVAQREASLRAARALYYDAIDDAWRAAQGSEPVSVELRTGLRLAATHAARTAADVARAMYDLGGGSAIYDDSPLQRRFRDAHAATAHFQVNAATWELTRTAAARPAHRHHDAVSRGSASRCRSGSIAPTRRRSRSRSRPIRPGSTRCGSGRWPRSTRSRSPPRSACGPSACGLKVGPLRDRRPQPGRDRARRLRRWRP